MTTVQEFSGRMEIATRAERITLGLLLVWNKPARLCGQETWLPKWVHEHIRHEYDDVAISMLRHFPDIDTGKVLIQVKSAPDSKTFPTVTIEEDSYYTCKALSNNNIPILVAWLINDERGEKIYANWINELHPNPPATPRENTNGSHTPYLIVNKNELKPIHEFREQL